MKKTILIIDDDSKLIQLLTQYLGQYGFEIRAALKPDEGIEIITKSPPSLVILDVMLPGKNGFDVCKEIRAISTVPIIMLTARDDVSDRIVGLEIGADDYLSKPFEPRELLARIESVLRRTDRKPITQDKVLEFGDLRIDFGKRTVAIRKNPVDLTTMEFDALALFASQPGQVLSRNQIMDHLRGIDWEAYNRSIDVLMSRLRQKLKDNPKNPNYFKTIWGTGYLFLGGPTNPEEEEEKDS